MNELIIESKDGKSAKIIMNNDYIVIKGKHLRIRDNYIYHTDKNTVIAIKDILSIEYLKLRSKRMFVSFIIIAGIITAAIGKALSAISKLNVNAMNKIMNTISDFGSETLLVFFILAIILEICIAVYMLKPKHLLRISAIGSMSAVCVKNYKERELDMIILEWLRIK